MKKLIPLLLLLVFMVSCKKEKVTPPPPQHVPDRRELLTALVSKICGNYSTTVICRTTGEPADTTYNYPLTIVALNDTTIFTCGKQLFFVLCCIVRANRDEFWKPKDSGQFVECHAPKHG